MRITSARSFARWAIALRSDRASRVDAARFSLHLVDCLGCGYAAIRKNAFTNVSHLVEPRADDSGASILGRSSEFSAEDAAFANGALFHALDFDDTHSPSVCHATAVVMPAALAAAQVNKARGRDFFTACVAGVEIICRIGMARHNAFHLKGFHPSSVVGVFGAALASGLLMGLDEDELTNALGIAGSLAGGVFAYLDGDSNPKPIHVGQAARNGVVAARLARAGVTGPANIFESRFGLYGAFLGSVTEDLPKLIASLGQVWESSRMSIKPYPACHSMHACLDSAAALQAELNFSIDDVVGIHAYLASDRDVNLVMEPFEVKSQPASATVGKFSLPYSIASLIKDRKLSVDSYDGEKLARSDVLALARRVTYERKSFPTSGTAMPGAVQITLKSDEKHYREVLNERGGPKNPLSDADIIDKFFSNLGGEIPRLQGHSVVQRMLSLSSDESPVSRSLVDLPDERAPA